MSRPNWVAAGGCVGFLFLGGLAVISEVGLEQLLIRAIVGALVGGLAGWGMTRFFEYQPPHHPSVPGSPQDEEFVPLDLSNQAEVVDRDTEHT